MIESLITSLRTLAAPADVQLRATDAGAAGGPVGEDTAVATAGAVPDVRGLASDFADALLLVSDCPQVLLNARQRQALDTLDAQLEGMLRDGGVRVWQPSGVRESVEWKTVRRLAAEALRML